MSTHPDTKTADGVKPQQPRGHVPVNLPENITMNLPEQHAPGPNHPEQAVVDDNSPVDPLLESIQHQVALFARRAEQTRLGGVGQARNSMDRAAYLLLNRLDQEGPTGVKALAAGMGIDSSTVTRQVAPLVDSGLVKRASHPDDGRAVVLELSPRGRQRLEQVRTSRRDLMAVLTKDWTPQERDVFCSLLTRFNIGLSEIHAPFGLRDGAGS